LLVKDISAKDKWMIMSAWTKKKKNISTEKKLKAYRKHEDERMKKDNCDLSSHCESSLPFFV